MAAGSAALPTLLKLASLAAVQPLAEQLAGEQLPVEIPLGREFCFQSIFACPVSRDQVRLGVCPPIPPPPPGAQRWTWVSNQAHDT